MCGSDAAVRLGLPGQERPQRTGNRRWVDVQPAQHAGDDPVLLFGKRDQQVFGLDLGVAQLRRQLWRGQNGFLSLLGKLVEVHDSSS